MKNDMLNKETNYSLNNPDNYKQNFDCIISVIAEKYSELIIEYYNFIFESIKFKNSDYAKYIIIRGLDTLTNVFLNILFFTKNIELTYFHCQKSFYFYVEFVGQISDDEKSFLQLTSRDATNYVYKKSIYEIHQDLKKPNEENYKKKYDAINSYIKIFQMYLLKIINVDNPTLSNKYINNVQLLCNKINSCSNKININDIERITEKMYNKINNIDTFFELNVQVLKKYIKNNAILYNIEKKIDLDEFNNKLDDSVAIIISYLLN
jgi:hypothetical protein